VSTALIQAPVVASYSGLIKRTPQPLRRKEPAESLSVIVIQIKVRKDYKTVLLVCVNLKNKGHIAFMVQQ